MQIYINLKLQQLTISLAIVLFCTCLSKIEAKTARYRCIIRDEPATTITIGWDQLSGTNPSIHYGTTDYGNDIKKYTLKDSPQRVISAKGMNNHFVRLSKLKPNTVYYFVIL